MESDISLSRPPKDLSTHPSADSTPRTKTPTSGSAGHNVGNHVIDLEPQQLVAATTPPETYVDKGGVTRAIPPRCVQLVDLVVAEGVTLRQAGQRLGIQPYYYSKTDWFGDYLRSRLTGELVEATVESFSILRQLLCHNDPQIRLKAAKEILDRGIGTVLRHDHQVRGKVSVDIEL